MTEILLPIGRMIGGDLYKMFPVTDSFGKPKMAKDGVTPRTECNLGIAIAKGGEAHWNQTPWGAEIWKVGQTAYPQAFVSPDFAWKVIDGDSTVPNKKGRAPCIQEGYKGHWVIWLKQGWLPRLVSSDGQVELGPNSILPGYYVRVLAAVLSNAPSPSPGVFINPQAVALMGEGDIIETASQVDTSVFASAPPSAVPAGMRTLTAAVPAFGAVPGVTAAPNPAFLQVPPPPAAPKPPGRTMTEAAGGCSYAQMIEAGWTDAMMIENGMMLP